MWPVSALRRQRRSFGGRVGVSGWGWGERKNAFPTALTSSPSQQLQRRQHPSRLGEGGGGGGGGGEKSPGASVAEYCAGLGRAGPGCPREPLGLLIKPGKRQTACRFLPRWGFGDVAFWGRSCRGYTAQAASTHSPFLLFFFFFSWWRRNRWMWLIYVHAWGHFKVTCRRRIHLWEMTLWCSTAASTQDASAHSHFQGISIVISSA